MKKRLFGLVPLLVVMALVAVPSAAQAAPHAYKNNSIIPEGEKVPTLAWGTLKLENLNLGLIECHNIFSGNEENPAGGGAAKGELEGYSAYNCVSASCEASGKAVEVFPKGLDNPKEGSWALELIEPVAGTIKLKTGNKAAANPQQIKFITKCTGLIEAEFHGELTPNVKNGTSIGATPSKVEFLGASSGELESTVGTGTVSGKVKLMGYEGQELLTSKNP